MTAAFLRRLGTSLISALLLATAAAAADAPSVLVQTTTVRRGSLPRMLTVYGTVQPDSSARNTLMAPLAASVAAIYVRAGEQVASGAPLLLLVPSPSARAAYAQAVSALQVANESVARTRTLLGEQLATQQQLADAQKAQSDARAALVALRSQGADGPTTLQAPFRAIITAISTSIRALVTEGTPLLDLVRPSGLALMAGVVPDQARLIAPGDAARVTPVAGSGAYLGKVVLRGAIVDPGNGLVPVQISLPPGALLPGQTAQALITTGSVHGYIVPHRAVLVNDAGDPYLVQAVHGTARIVAVRVLDEVGDQDAVDGALDAAAPLILAGNYQLQDSMPVRLSDAADQRSR